MDPLGHRGAEAWEAVPGRGHSQVLPRSPPPAGSGPGVPPGPPDPCPPRRQSPAWIPGQGAGRHRAPREFQPRFLAQLSSQLGEVLSGRGLPGDRRSRPGGGAGPQAPLRAPFRAFRAPSPACSFIDRARSRPIHPGVRGAPLPWQPPPPAPTAQPERWGGRGSPRGPCVCVGGVPGYKSLGGCARGSPRSHGCRRGGLPPAQPRRGSGSGCHVGGEGPPSLPGAGAGARPRRFPSWAELGAA